MEAIRKAVGARTLTLFGISYGTELALAYARAYPRRVDRLILDSVVDPDESDPFGLAGFRAMGPSLPALCPDALPRPQRRPRRRPGGADREAARRTAARLLVRRARAPPARHAAPDRDRRPALRRRLQPGAARRRADGGARGARQRRRGADAAPAGRLRRLRVPSDPRDFSAARYAAVCEETPLPWPRGTGARRSLGGRPRRALALPGSAFAPFDAEVAYADEIDLCLRWPDPGRPPRAAGGAYPAVPTLLLQGEEDLRTPPEVSAHVATLIAGAQRVTAPGVGHAVIGDPSGCGRRQLLRFVAGEEVRARCPRVADRRPRDGRAAGLVRRARAGRAGSPGRRGEDGERRRRDARLPRLRALSRAERRTGAAVACAAARIATGGGCR